MKKWLDLRELWYIIQQRLIQIKFKRWHYLKLFDLLSLEIELTMGHRLRPFIKLNLTLRYILSIKEGNVKETITLRLIEASLGREHVADRTNFRYNWSQPDSLIHIRFAGFYCFFHKSAKVKNWKNSFSH